MNSYKTNREKKRKSKRPHRAVLARSAFYVPPLRTKPEWELWRRRRARHRKRNNRRR